MASVSAVLSGSDKRYVSSELRERILAAAKEMDYVKSYMASGLRGVSQKVIALLIPQFDNPYFNRLAISVERVAHDNDYTIFVCDTQDDPEKERNIVETVIGHRVDGIIIAPTASGAENTELVRKYNIPYVVVDRQLATVEEYDFIAGDSYQAGVLGARKLLTHGHKRFGYIGWKSKFPIITQRQDGFKDTVAPYAEFYDYRLSDEMVPEEGYSLTKELLESGGGITAILYGLHRLTSGGIEYFREAGLSIPRDLSVIQIGTPEWATIMDPPFTCIYQPIEEIGAIAAQTIFEKINGSRNIIETRILRHTLIEGGTVADVLY